MKHEVFVISPKKESVINENEQKENFSETRNMNSEFITMEFHKNMGEITNEITTQKSKRKAAKNHELSEENAVKIMKNNLTPESQLPVDTLTPSTPASLSNNFVDLSSLRSSQLDHNIPKKDYFSMLPDEVLLLIFKIFQHKPTLITCACVCRRWKEIAFDSDLWPRIELSQKKILPGIMLHILNRKPTVLRMSQTEISTPIFCNVEQIMENFVSKLEYLDLSMATILPADLELLLRTCRILLKLSLESCTVNYNICVEISKNPRLSVLNMSQCMGLDETGMKEILVNCKKLVELNIAWTKLSPAAIKCICQSLTKDILKLNFSGCFYAINDAYLSNLVIRCNKLKELDLSDSTGISDKSIQVICDNLNNLEVLSLSRCYNIYPSTYTKLFRLPSITHLNIFGLFIETQIETLRKTSHIKLNTMKFSYIARPTVGHRRTSIWNMQLIGLILLTLVPWPGPTVFKIKCPRDNAAVVRRLIQNKWIPVLNKYQVKLPLECPFHPMRDIFYPQESAKRQHRSSQWTCTFCGKSFYQEKYLDLHFDNRHRNKINMAEDAICLADYCDIMRCEVLQTQNEKQNDNVNSESSQQYRGSKSSPITDLEVWREPTQRTALSIVSNSIKSPSTISNENNLHSNHNLCDKSEAPQIKNQNNSQSIRKCETLVDSVVPPRQRFIELQKLKANCKTDDLLKLKLKCEGLVRDCIAGLLINLSVQDFKDIEVELNNAVCWYLTCDRYWEDTQSNPRHFSWGLIFVPVILLSLGLTLCYYIIWIFFDSNDLSPIEENTLHNYSRYQCVKQYSDEYYPASDVNPSNNHYIYVTYPPEIKRKLLDSCYNRTTRL